MLSSVNNIGEYGGFIIVFELCSCRIAYEKHHQYAIREAQSLRMAKATNNRRFRIKGLMTTVQAERKKWIRENVWNHLPLLLKPFVYFMYRYFLRLGFLDGREGLVFHFLQGCWFQFLIDVKYLEEIKINKIVTET